MKRVHHGSFLALALVLAAPAASAQEPSGQGAPPEAAAPPGSSGEAGEVVDAGVDAPAAKAPSASSTYDFGASPAERPPPLAAPRYDLLRVNVGLRVGYVATAGFDTFASSDELAQLSIDATYPLLTRGKFVLGAGLGWDVGGRSDDVRGMKASLTAHRLYVPIEGRYHLAPWLYGFGKLSPGAAVAIASVEDASSPNRLSATGLAFSGDVSVGASFLVTPRAKMQQRRGRFWVTPEIGWSVTTSAPMHPNPGRADEELLGSDEDASLRSLALSGFFWRASVGMTF